MTSLNNLQDFHIIMEYCAGGSLFSRLKSKGTFFEALAAEIIRKLAMALHICHEKGIMHRDIKPENILMASSQSDTDIRLADFGSAAHFLPGQKLNQLVGSPLYIATSVLQHSYGPEADMWSLGVVWEFTHSAHRSTTF
jgi:calcium-dependent protein kinase